MKAESELHSCSDVSHGFQVELGDVWGAERAQVQTAGVLVDLADVRHHQAIGVMEAPRADAPIMELRHQTVARNKLHQNVRAEKLRGMRQF